MQPGKRVGAVWAVWIAGVFAIFVTAGTANAQAYYVLPGGSPTTECCPPTMVIGPGDLPLGS